jgi:hypothetical protein
VPDGSRDVLLDRVLLECGFDELNAIDWKKGAIWARTYGRTRYRGLVRKRLIPVYSGETTVFQGPVFQGN